MASDEERILEERLLSDSIELLRTPSPSLNLAEVFEVFDSDEEDDGINVTIKAMQPPAVVVKKEKFDENDKSEIPEEAMDIESPQPVRHGLCGSARRRLKKLMSDGMDYAAARERAKLPLASTPKRQRNADHDRSKSSEEKPLSKKMCDDPHRQVNCNVVKPKNVRNVEDTASGSQSPAHSHQPNIAHGRGREALPAPTYSDIASRVRVGILPKNYPEVELSTSQLEVVQEALLLKVVEQKREQFKPKFVCCRFKPGYLVLTCQDKDTAIWVKEKLPTITLWEGADLVVVDEDQIPRPDVLIVFFPWSVKYGNDMILSLIESQNENLLTDAWRILHRHVKGDHIELALTVDDSSQRKLEERNFVLNYRYGQIQLKKKRPAQSNSGESGNSCEGSKNVAMDSNEVHLQLPETSGGKQANNGSKKASQKAIPKNSSVAGSSGTKHLGQSTAQGEKGPQYKKPSNSSKNRSVQDRLQQK